MDQEPTRPGGDLTPSPEAIRSHIAETRAELEQAINALKGVLLDKRAPAPRGAQPGVDWPANLL